MVGSLPHEAQGLDEGCANADRSFVCFENDNSTTTPPLPSTTTAATYTTTVHFQWTQRALGAHRIHINLKTIFIHARNNEEVCAKIQQAIGPHEDLLTIVKRRKPQWYGNVFRSSGLAKAVLQGLSLIHI